MMSTKINPYSSPWAIPKYSKTKDHKCLKIYLNIKSHALSNIHMQEYHGCIVLNKFIYLAKNAMKFRIKSHLDWAYYTPKTLAQAIDNNVVDSYYEIMLKDINSDPNIWKDKDFEMELKSFYAARIGRASLL